MKTRTIIVALVVSCAMLWATGQVQAGFMYDFEGLSTGTLTGQDNWTDPSAPEPDWVSGNVAYGPAGSGNTTLCLQGTGTIATNDSNQRLFSPVYFTSADTAAEQQYSAYLDISDTGQQALAGAWFNGTHVYQCVYGIGDSGKSYFRSATDIESIGDTLTNAHWYDFKLVMDFSVAGGEAQLYYKDVTAGDPTFTQDMAIGTINMDLTPDGLGRYQVDGLTTRMYSTDSYVDNFSVGTIPEPSTITLLVTGLFGLLAYAWRKRK